MRLWSRRVDNPFRTVRNPNQPHHSGGFGVIFIVTASASLALLVEYFAYNTLLGNHLTITPKATEGREGRLFEGDRQNKLYISSSSVSASSRRDKNDHHDTEVLEVRKVPPSKGEVHVSYNRENIASETQTTPLLRRNSETAPALLEAVAAAGTSSSAVNETQDLGKFQTLTRLRDDKCGASDCRVLITGCGRSGTHFLAEQLVSAGMPILHERIGEVGTVSWVHTALYKEEFRELEEWFSDAKSVSLRSSKNFQFFPVFHLVRHPLAALTSLTECFCGCGSMSCGGWADPPSWKWAGKFVEFSNQYCSRMKEEEVCTSHNHSSGRLIRSMEYWIQWNELAGSQAHFRLQLETVKLAEVFEAIQQLDPNVLNGATISKGFEQKAFATKSRRRRQVKGVTWDLMRSADTGLEERVWELAQAYGYTRDPP